MVRSLTVLRMFLRPAFLVALGVVKLLSAGCGRDGVAVNNTVSTPTNVAVAVKPTEAEVKQADTKPVGKEIKAADGPALKSVIPPEGAILGGVLNNIAVDLPKPEYPADAKGAKGTVTVEVLVNEKGVVTTSSVVSGPQPLWSAAGAAARQAKFDPPLKDGKPVKVAGVLTYDFDK
jgi:TonB family protein